MVHQTNFLELLLSHYVPAGVLIDQYNEIVFTKGQVENYLDPSIVEKESNFFRLIREGLSTHCYEGISRVRNGAKQITYPDVSFLSGTMIRRVSLRFLSFPHMGSGFFILIEFHPDPNTPANPEFSARPAEKKHTNPIVTEALRKFDFTDYSPFTPHHADDHTIVNSALDQANPLGKDWLTATGIAAVWLEEGLKIKAFTPPATRYFNFLAGDVGRPIYHFTHHFTDRIFPADALRVMQTLAPLEKELQDTEGHFFRLRMIPYRTPESSSLGIVLTVTDITESKRTILNLRDLTHVLGEKISILEKGGQLGQTFLNHFPDLIAGINSRLELIYLNPALEKEGDLLGEQWQGKSLLEPMPFRGMAFLEDVLKEVVKTGQLTESIFTVEEPGRRQFQLLVVPGSLPGIDSPETILVLARDVTKFQAFRTELQKQNMELELANQSLQQFVYVASHDLRSPVSRMKALLHLLQLESGQGWEDYLPRINGEVTRMENILNGLLALTKVQITETIAQRIFFQKVFSQVASEFEKDLQETKMHIRVQFSACPAIWYVEEFMLSIFRNLLSNAIKYHAPGRKPSLLVSTQQEGALVLLTFQDNGIGIDLAQNEAEIFRPLKRFTTQAEGTGMGLYLVKEMVEKNGGKIKLVSRPNHGTTFYLYLQSYDAP